MTKTKHKLTLWALALLLVFSLGTCIYLAAVPRQEAYAAGNTATYKIYATESINNDVIEKMPLSTATDTNESYYRNSGVMIYAPSTNGTTSSTNAVKLDSTQFTVDFSGAYFYMPANNNVFVCLPTYYAFEIVNSYGSTVWYARQTQTSVKNNDTTTYTLTTNVNGRSTKQSNTSGYQIDASMFGKPTVTLSSGSYTFRIRREYTWANMPDGDIFKMSVYQTDCLMSGTLLVDAIKPTLSAKGYSTSKTISTGSYVNERVIFTASDTNFSRIYYKTPTSSSYTYTTSKTYTTGTTNGWYYGYAADTVGNTTDTFSFYYDSTAPSGKISSNGTTVTSGAYIAKSFSYSATDSGSGVTQCYYKTPTSGSFQPYTQGTIIPANAGDGWYYFYSVDRSGNQSSTQSVYLETAAPLVEIYRNGELAYSKSMTASGSYDTGLYLRPNDSLKISCDTSSGKVTSNYTLDTNIVIGSSYPNDSYTITLTSATGLTSNFKYYIVRDNPTFTIGGKTYSGGETLYFNADTPIAWACSSVVADTADTGLSIVSEGDVNLNEFIRYKDGKSKTLTTADGTETKYVLSQTDRAGNQSKITVIIDKSAPVGSWQSNGNALENGGYTNKPLSFVFAESDVTAICSYNGGEYQPYTSGKTFSADGAYTVVLTDLAKNKTIYSAYIDTVAPTGQLYADYSPVDNGAITNGKVYFSWEGDATATVNGKEYAKNSVLSDDGEYSFVLTDRAGNRSTCKITVDTVVPAYNADKLTGSAQMISRWYLISFDGEKYSFADYDEALAFAADKEFAAFVTVLNLDDVADFNQHHLVADNGSIENTDDEVRTGEYWLYKSKANPDSLLYYFDRNLLSEAVAHYAKDYISTVNYFVQDGSNEYGTPADSMSDNLMTAPDGTTVPGLNGFVFDKADSVQLYAELVGGDGAKVKVAFGTPFDEQFSVGGMYRLTELDEAGNATVFYGFLDVLPPKLNVTATIFGNEQPTELTITKDGLAGIAAYYYESFNVGSIADADKWSVLSVQSGGKVSYYTYGDELPTLHIGGEYLLTLYDRSGNGYSFTVYIVGNAADISFRNNSDNTAFSLTISLEQSFDTLVSLEIKRNGELLEGVSTDMLSYTFDKAGVYTVTLRDNFGRVIEREYTFYKALPVGELSGAENGGKTKTDVGFIFDSGKYYAEVTKDGVPVETDNSGELRFIANDANSGNYVIRLVNLTDEENFTEYFFVINTLAPDFDLPVSDGATTSKDVTVSWTADDVENVAYSLNGGELVALEKGAKLTAEGVYTIVATNDLGTQSEKTFTIDKTLDYYMTVGEQTATVDVTGETVALFANENLYVSVTKNGAPMTYAFGDILSEEAAYAFRVWDDFGNAVTFTVKIDKSVDFTANVADGVISNGGVTFANGEKLTVTVTKDREIIDYTFGQSLDEEGAYKIVLRDNCGNEKTVAFRIVSGVKNAIDYTLGEGVEILSVTRDGENVAVEGNRLNFTADGAYTVTVRAEGKEYAFTLSLDATAPTVVIDGTKLNGKTNGPAVISEPDESAVVEVYFNGEKIEYELGGELTEYGDYRVVLTDAAGNVSEYSFTLAHVLNSGAIALIVIMILVVIGVTVTTVIMRKKGKFGKNKEEKKKAE